MVSLHHELDDNDLNHVNGTAKFIRWWSGGEKQLRHLERREEIRN